MIIYKKIKFYVSQSEVIDLIIKEHDGKNTTIPVDESIADYQEYLEWIAEGNEPEVIND